MLAYIDYPGWRRLITDFNELNRVLTEDIRRAASLIVMIGGGYDASMDSDFLRVWYGVTDNRSLIEDVNAMVVQVRRGLMGLDELGAELVRTLDKRRYGLIDLIMMNNYLKLTLDVNAYDLGLIILYENPESILVGIREPGDLIPNKLMSRELEVDLDAKCMVVKRRFSIYVSKQFKSGVNVVDWSNPGIVPYTKFTSMRINGVEVSDPIFTSFAKLHLRITSRPAGSKLVLTLPKAMDVQVDSDYCGADSFISMPQSMGLSDYLAVIGILRGMGYTVLKAPFTRVDELVKGCGLG
ncbi:hypothetical protein [Vulcanisaeta thermophila]|uniref:hypothetical protein n=1 Tax=Vulcanisaeta thermophila TaxID=867917 RepID=UPI000853982B|nr:hypothetical protein [Vulcanisaeta thermophila]